MIRDEHGFLQLVQTREGFQQMKAIAERSKHPKKKAAKSKITKNSNISLDMLNNAKGTVLRKTVYGEDDPGFPVKSWSRTLWNESYAKIKYKERYLLKGALYSGKNDWFIRNVNSVIIKERCNLIDRNTGENIKIVRVTTPIIYDLDRLTVVLHDIMFHVATSYETEIPFYDEAVVKSNREVHCHVKALIRLTNGKYIAVFGSFDKLLKALKARAVISPKAKNGFTIEYY